jgi:hypothetical protein
LEKEVIKFHDNALNEAEDYYKELHISRKQRRKIVMVSKLATNYIHGINEYAMCGFAFRAITQYQVDNQIELIAFETMSPEAKMEMLADVMNRVKNTLATIMVDKDKAHILDNAVKELLKFYKNNLI